MRVLLTGVTGFIGHHILAHIMKHTDWEVVGLSRSFFSGRTSRISEIMDNNEEWYSRFTLIHHDLRDPIHEDTARQIGHIDIIYHVAGNSHVDRSILNPREFLRDNVDSTINLMDFSITRKGEVSKFIYYSTDEVYGHAPDGVTHDENFPHKPGNPYAASKAAAEDFCWAYMKTYGVPIIIMNTMNIIGERQHLEKFVPKIMKSCLTGEKLMIHAHPDGKRAGSRHYLHAENSAAALEFIVEHGQLGEKYNVVGEKVMDNLELAHIIYGYIKEWNDDRGIVTPSANFELTTFDPNRPGHDLRYAMNPDKLLSMGYAHPVGFDEGLKRTVLWTLEHQDWLGL